MDNETLLLSNLGSGSLFSGMTTEAYKEFMDNYDWREQD